MIFSLINADLLFTTKQARNRALNILAKVQSILLFALAVWELISVLLS